MKDKFSSKLDFQYHILSTFHRGLFWGAIVSWIAIISGIFGAAVTKILVVDRKNTVVAQNYANPQFLPTLDSLQKQVNSDLTPISMSSVNSSAIDFSSDSTDKFKNTKIVIQNTTNDPELANQVYAYLKERNFRNMAIAESNYLYFSKTILTTQSQNLEAANYLKNTLNLGILDLVENQSFDGYSQPKLIIQLGEDAQFFMTKRNFTN